MLYEPAVLISALDAKYGAGNEVVWAGTGSAGSNAWSSGSRGVYMPIVFDKPGIVTKLWCANGAAVSGNIDMALYASDGLLPTSRLAASGGVAQAGVSTLQEFDIADVLVLPFVRYFVGVSLDNTAGTLAQIGLASTALARITGAMQQAGAYPLPNPAVPVAIGTALLPHIGVAMRDLVA